MGNLAGALGSAAAPASMATTFALPVVLMLGGVALLMIALAPIASELRLAVARSSESFRQWASRPRPGFT